MTMTQMSPKLVGLLLISGKECGEISESGPTLSAFN